MRREHDPAGVLEVPENALYGIHAKRAALNFPDNTPFYIEWYKAVGLVKLAYYRTYKNYKSGLRKKYGDELPFVLFDDMIIDVLIETAEEVCSGKYFNDFIVPAVSGGAGTSINMNVNEIIANASLLKLGENCGRYDIIHPIEHANIFQSTNDVIPSALKVAVILLLIELEESVNSLRRETEKLETQHRNTLRIAYTQMQEAVPSSYGALFGAYNEALSRDWWRISKCFERIKTVNLGGSAVGTGITVPVYFIMEVVQELQKIVDIPVAKSENLADATSNLDPIVEVHAILKSHAVNIEKITSDIRLLASDINGKHEIEIPARQTGSSVMPGKINPVIVEYAVSAAHKVYANDSLISSLCGLGALDLNAYLPVIGHHLIESVKLLISANNTLRDNLFSGIKINKTTAYNNLICSPSITTALVPFIGYEKSALIAKKMYEAKVDIFDACRELSLIREDVLTEILKPENILKKGYTVKDIITILGRENA